MLVVEDDPATREMLCRSLRAEGWGVAAAADGPAALAMVARTKPSLILLDLMLPGMDGFEFLGHLRKSKGGETVPVVVLTGRDITAEERQQLGGQVSRIFGKSGTGREELLREVENLVRGKGATTRDQGRGG